MENYDYIGLGKRLLALFFDAVLIVLVMMLGYWLMDLLPAGFVVPMSVFGTILYLCYWVVLPVKIGGTIGKKLVGCRIISSNGDNIGYKQSIIRNAPFFCYSVVDTIFNLDGTRLISLVLFGLFFIFYVAEVIVLITNDKKRSIHDLMAGSYVVDDSEYKFDTMSE